MNIVVLISGNGSNLQSIINAQQMGSLNVNIKAIISNNPDAFGLERATDAGLQTEIIASKNYNNPHDFDDALKKCIDRYQPDLIVLAGFMKIVGSSITNSYEYRIINIHPSLLPKYPGLHTHKRVIENKDKIHGCTIHFVNHTLDGGPILAQAHTSVAFDDTPLSLKTKIQKLEHVLYPRVIGWFAQKRLSIKKGSIFMDSQIIPVHGVNFFFSDNPAIDAELF